MDDSGEPNDRPLPVATLIGMPIAALWVILHATLPDSSDNPQVRRVIEAMQAVQEFLHIDR